MSAPRRSFSLPTLIIATLALIVTTPAPVTAQVAVRYVALGDSYASGPLIPNQRTDPIGCFRSDHNYAALVATALGATDFVDVTCGGATTSDMTQPQDISGGTAPPQFDALTADTSLVTITISGNDIGFTDILTTCASESVSNPVGHPCQDRFTSGGTDELAGRIATAGAKVAAVLRGIGERAPNAELVVVGYLRILPDSNGCWPVVPIAWGDVPYLNAVEASLNAMLRDHTAAVGGTFVNPDATGHDSCQSPANKWVEGIVPTSLAAPVHPNAAGMAAVAQLVLGALNDRQ